MNHRDMIQVMAKQLESLDTDIKDVQVEYLKCRMSRPKQCFNNAVKYLMELREPHARYVLGYVLYDMGGVQVPLEHAWVFTKGKYIDVTLENPGQYVSVYEMPWEKFQAYKDTPPDLFDLNRLLR